MIHIGHEGGNFVAESARDTKGFEMGVVDVIGLGCRRTRKPMCQRLIPYIDIRGKAPAKESVGHRKIYSSVLYCIECIQQELCSSSRPPRCQPVGSLPYYANVGEKGRVICREVQSRSLSFSCEHANHITTSTRAHTKPSLVVQAIVIACISESISITRCTSCFLRIWESEEIAATRVLHALCKCLVASNLDIAD